MDEQTVLYVTIYDQRPLRQVSLKINRKITGKDVCQAIASMIDLQRESQFYSLVLVATTYDAAKKSNMFCVRTLKNTEQVIRTMDTFLVTITDKFNIADTLKLKRSIKWFYKDVRSSPLELGEGEMVGEYDSDDEEELSHSDLAYLTKSERKGYLLKRSSSDANLWRKWYCILTDQLWCIDVSATVSRAICIKLTGATRSKDGEELKLGDRIQNIIINSPKRTHLFRAFTVPEQKKWVDELNLRTKYGGDNELFELAEVITTDEENSRSQRLRRPISELLDIQSVYERIMTDYRRSSHLSTALSSATAVSSSSSSSSRPAAQTVSHRPAAQDALEGDRSNDSLFVQYEDGSNNSNTASSSSSRKSDSSGDGSGSEAVVQHAVDSDDSDDSDDDHGNSSAEKAAEGASSTTPVVSVVSHHSAARRLIHPLDRSRQTPTMHRLHGFEPRLAQVIKYLLDVGHYKELFRHDLFVLPAKRRQTALTIFSEHLFPQLHLVSPGKSSSTQSRWSSHSWGIRKETLLAIQAKLFPNKEQMMPTSHTSRATAWSSAKQSSRGSPFALLRGGKTPPSSGSGARSDTLRPEAGAGAAVGASKDVEAEQDALWMTVGDNESHAELFDESIEDMLQALRAL